MIVRRESGRGMAVVWVFIAVTVLNLVVVVAKFVAAVPAVNAVVNQYR
ncbi:hypothetical protein [Subtercola boreus]|nr:hypothetical protein [Subtercola boreus]